MPGAIFFGSIYVGGVYTDIYVNIFIIEAQASSVVLDISFWQWPEKHSFQERGEQLCGGFCALSSLAPLTSYTYRTIRVAKKWALSAGVIPLLICLAKCDRSKGY